VVSYSSITSFYFVGYGLGIIFFFVPDTLGRKGSMNIFASLYTINTYLSTYPKNIALLKIGFFFNGFFHMKHSLCYMHGVELMPDKHKALI